MELGLTGLDQIKEADQFENIEDLLDLKFGSCKLQIQVPANGPYNTPEELVGKKIVSSFTKLSQDYFGELSDKPTSIRYVGGSVEASCALGVADAIVDLVESGETMKAAGLKAIATVLETSAHLISSKKSQNPEMVKIIVQRLQGVLAAQEYVLCNYNAPKAIQAKCLSITPGRRAATVSTLDKHSEDEEDWVAISSMVKRKEIGNVMDELKQAGASDILVLEISNCRV